VVSDILFLPPPRGAGVWPWNVLTQTRVFCSAFRLPQIDFPAQIDFSFHGFELRLSDPYVVVSEINDDSFLKEFGVEKGDAVITVNGHGFDTVTRFVELVKQHKDMVGAFVRF